VDLDPMYPGTVHSADWLAALDWVIVGGESGPKARPMHPDWARSLRDQCVNAGVPYFFKQWGEWGPLEGSGAREPTPIGHWVEDFNAVGRRVICEAGDQAFVGGMTSRGVPHQVRVGKKAAGRELDGRTWDEMPEELESQSDSTEDSAGGAMGQVKV
jgi:protein gp37